MISLITSDIELLEVYYAHTVSPIAIAALTTIVMVSFIASLWALLNYCTVGILISLINSRYTGKPGRAVRGQLGDMSTYGLDSMYGIEESLQYGRLEAMNQRSNDLAKSQQRLAKLGSWQGLATSLDALNEGIILKSLKEAAKDKTIIIVSHRKSTLAIADRILELEPLAAS